jgi:hypothetical protein
LLTKLKTVADAKFSYSYEEFADHVKAMKTVRDWEYTSRFGHLGDSQSSRAHNARVLEYFSDTYQESAEAVGKAELFLSIYDYLGRHALYFSRKGLVERLEGNLFAVEPTLLRAVHYLFTTATRPASMDPKRIFNVAKALAAIEAPI